MLGMIISPFSQVCQLVNFTVGQSVLDLNQAESVLEGAIQINDRICEFAM